MFFRYKPKEKRKKGAPASCILHRASLQGGFTVVEILVSVGIFAIITSIVLVNNAKFNNALLLGNLAYDVALSIREAQTYGLNVRGASSGGTTLFTAGYGITFRTTTSNAYELFADLNNNHINNGGNELVRTYSVSSGYAIKDICGTPLGGGTKQCKSNGLLSDGISLSFMRPNPDAFIRSLSGSVSYTHAEIILVSPQGKTRMVSIESTGQISIQQQ